MSEEADGAEEWVAVRQQPRVLWRSTGALRLVPNVFEVQTGRLVGERFARIVLRQERVRQHHVAVVLAT
eukprot:1020898-Prymnesium_polylepis.2